MDLQGRDRIFNGLYTEILLGVVGIAFILLAVLLGFGYLSGSALTLVEKVQTIVTWVFYGVLTLGILKVLIILVMIKDAVLAYYLRDSTGLPM